jgi:hypothetical protein
MVREGVVGALRTIYQSLRSGGLLLDVHPEPEHARIQVWAGSAIHDLGHLDDTAIIDDALAGRAVIDMLIREGLFVRDRQVVFEQVVHVSDVDTWLAYRQARAARSRLDPLIIERARELLAADEGEIRIVEHSYAARFRKP